MIAAGIVSFFAFISLTASSIVTFVARKMLFPEQLNQHNVILLTLIFATTTGFVFVTLYPLDFYGNRKDEK